MMMIGSSVDCVRSGGMGNVPVTKAVEHLYATTAKFSGCVLLASRPAYSYPPRRGVRELWDTFQKPAGVVSPKLSRILLEKGAVSPLPRG
ncbi:hypothetical protein AVEN_254-1 [Araneus ventricosus]|uniref:Uncharacterized protein n=1 Tax=Araneus ventricosus TaxID=182803 RepID=A0A4Y2KBD1_ARAVE|nr:hypothetical protein AVEN_254-1 [Araneus ventricosus]